MKSYFRIACLLLTLLGLISCKKEVKLTAEVEPAPSFDTRTPLGLKQKEIFDKYGITIDYKWNRFAFDANAVADPAKEEDVLPYIELLQEVFFNAMDFVAGAGVVEKKEVPVKILLIGSGINYGGLESFGESTVGQAGHQQPSRITFGMLNFFGDLLRAKSSTSDADFLNGIFVTSNSLPVDAGIVGFIYHEYTHYLDKKNQIPKGFEIPSKTEYLRGSDQFKNVPLATAISKGFFINYGMQNESEDLATYVQTILWKTDAQLSSTYLVNNLTTAKYKLVTKYFEDINLPLLKIRDYLNQPSVRAKIIQIKRKYE